jgi:uncharacterized protein (TIGR02284 family)
MTPVETLDLLIAICVDSERRYRHAARDVGRDDLETFFKEQAAKRKAAADQLQSERSRLGVVEKEAGTLSGFVDRLEMDLSVIHSMGDSGVVEWCRQDGEKVAREYEKALSSEDLPPDLRGLLERQLATVRVTVSELKRILLAYGGPRS